MILAYSGQHKEGITLLERVIRSEPRLPPGVHTVLSDARYLGRDYAGALTALEAVANPPYYLQLCQAACLAQLGRTDEAWRIVASAPEEFDCALMAQLSARLCVLTEDAEHWLEGFRKAGVPV